jgi:hypothetical protein
MKYFNALLAAAASLLVVISSAKAEVVNLECHSTTAPADYPYLVFWIDFNQKTITSGSARYRQIEAGVPLTTVPVRITPGAFDFSTSMGAVTINRMTGASIWYGPPTQSFQCSKGTMPFPISKF